MEREPCDTRDLQQKTPKILRSKKNLNTTPIICFQADASGFQLCIIHLDDPELLPHFQLQITGLRNGKKEE
jgi:hypothetical protein